MPTLVFETATQSFGTLLSSLLGRGDTIIARKTLPPALFKKWIFLSVSLWSGGIKWLLDHSFLHFQLVIGETNILLFQNFKFLIFGKFLCSAMG